MSTTKSNSGDKRDRVKKLIRQSSEVGLFILEGEQVPKKFQGLVKKSSGILLDRILDSSNKMSSKVETEDKVRRSSLDYESPPKTRLETIPSPTLLVPGQSFGNIPQIEEIIETYDVGLDSVTELPLISNTRSLLSTPSFTIPFHDTPHHSSSTSMCAHDTISLSTTMGGLGVLEPSDGLKEAIALNYRELYSYSMSIMQIVFYKQ